MRSLATTSRHRTCYQNLQHYSTLCFALITAFAGCSGGAEGVADRPATTSVSGKVTYKNNPVEGATVVLSPTSKEGKAATGITDSSGKFNLRTFDTDDGAIPGEYNVTVTKLKSDPSVGVSEDSPDYDPNAQTSSEPEHLLPEKYASAETSDLTATIPADGEVTDLNFDLVD